VTADDIKAARALCEAATPGPWHHRNEPISPTAGYPWIAGPFDEDTAGECTIVEWNECGELANADAAFIAAARTLLPAALDALVEAREGCDATRECFRQSHDEVIRLMHDADEGREFDRRNVAEIDRLSADLAATKAALEEAMTLATDAVYTLSCWVSYIPDFKNRLAALKAKVPR
jgi:hypothetical protein